MSLNFFVRVAHRKSRLPKRVGIGGLGVHRLVEGLLRNACGLHERLAGFTRTSVNRLPLFLLFVGEAEMSRDHFDRRALVAFRSARAEAWSAGAARPAHVSFARALGAGALGRGERDPSECGYREGGDFQGLLLHGLFLNLSKVLDRGDVCPAS